MSKVYTVVALCVTCTSIKKINAQSITAAVRKVKNEGVCGAETIQGVRKWEVFLLVTAMKPNDS